MKVFSKIIIGFFVLVLVVGVLLFAFLKNAAPEYDGKLTLKGIEHPAEVIFDQHGVPHIYASSEVDACFALGYVHAQDRLFQMEMTRRLASGRLAEVLGADLVKTDAFFRTLGLGGHAENAANIFLSSDSLPYQRAAMAYLRGLNAYVREGKTPVEFTLLGIEKKEFTPTDLFLTAEYMAFNFSMAMRTDPLMSFIRLKLGENYFNDLATGYVPGTMTIPVKESSDSLNNLHSLQASRQNHKTGSVADVLDKLPVSPFTGSNAWVLSADRNIRNKVLFCNDTHIGFGQPSVWYEAHIVFPGMDFYGNYLAGFPFAAIGHTRAKAWGLTMLENDDMDFFMEKVCAEDTLYYIEDERRIPFHDTLHLIPVKDGSPVRLNVRSTGRGPIVSAVMPEWSMVTDAPVSMFWTHLQFPLNLMQITYQMAHSEKINGFRDAVSQIVSPGLNVMYGDTAGNIAWWAAAKLVKRPEGVSPVVISDGSDSRTNMTGYFSFEENPHAVNPEAGIVFNANNQPGALKGYTLYPGYYVPEDRALRIEEVFGHKHRWSLDEIRNVQLDHRSPITPVIANVIISAISDKLKNKTTKHAKVVRLLTEWNGDHGLQDVAPVIYYKLVYQVMRLAMEDEMGEENFRRYLSTHVMKTTLMPLIKNDSSVWWNNQNTTEVVESRSMIFEKAFELSIDQLSDQLGDEPSLWEWGRVHLLEHNHPVGIKKPLNLLFNVGPFPVPGGPEVLCQMGFDLNNEGVYKVKYGPAMRINIDFADPAHSVSVLPTGQSGNCMSEFYDNQAGLYNTGQFRSQMMDRSEILRSAKGRIVFSPR